MTFINKNFTKMALVSLLTTFEREDMLLPEHAIEASLATSSNVFTCEIFGKKVESYVITFVTLPSRA